MALSQPLAREVSLAAKFAAVCVIGFLADAIVLRVGPSLGLGATAARSVSLVVALQVTFGLSRWLVFRDRRAESLPGQWWRFMAANGFGCLCNIAIFVALKATRAPGLSDTWVALLVSSAAAFAVNYAGTRLLVYGRARGAPKVGREPSSARPAAHAEP